jgi:hypothetical protein
MGNQTVYLLYNTTAVRSGEYAPVPFSGMPPSSVWNAVESATGISTIYAVAGITPGWGNLTISAYNSYGVLSQFVIPMPPPQTLTNGTTTISETLFQCGNDWLWPYYYFEFKQVAPGVLLLTPK